MSNDVRAKKVLIEFPQGFSINEAIDLIRSRKVDDTWIGWKYDTMKYGIHNNQPKIYLERNDMKIQARVANLVKKGIVFKVGKDIGHMPILPYSLQPGEEPERIPEERLREVEQVHVKARRILVIFPKDYTLREAYERVLAWNPDRDSLQWGLVNGVPYVYAEKESKFSIKTKVLQSKGIYILSGDRLKRIPSLDNPSLSNTQSIVQNQLPETQTREPIQEEKLRELISIETQHLRSENRSLAQELTLVKNRLLEQELEQLKNRVINLEKELAAIKTQL